MEQKKTTLDRLRAGEMGQLLTVGGEGALRQHSRYGSYPRRRGNIGEVRPYGRPAGSAYP